MNMTVDTGARTSVQIGFGLPQTGRFEATALARPGEDLAVVVRRGEQSSTYKVRCLPMGFPRWKFERTGSTSPGLFAVATANSDSQPWIIVFDGDGVPRWWHSPRTDVLGAQVLSDGTVAWPRAFGDGYGQDPRMAHEVRSLSGDLVRLVRTEGSITDGHEFRELPSGNILINSYRPEDGIDLSSFILPGQQGPRDGSAVFAEIQEVDPSGKVVWRWNSRGHIGLEETPVRWRDSIIANPHPGPFGPTYDPVHLNSVDAWGADRLIISTRHTDAVYGIDKETGDIVFKLGGTPTPESLAVVGDPAGPATPGEGTFGGQHDARIDAEGNLTVFDNGTDRARDPRVVTYQLDIEEGTATYAGELTDPRIDESHCCGSARQTPAGEWLVSWGDESLITEFDIAGEVAFRLTLPTPSFRAVPVPVGSVTPGALDDGLEAMERRDGLPR